MLPRNLLNKKIKAKTSRPINKVLIDLDVKLNALFEQSAIGSINMKQPKLITNNGTVIDIDGSILCNIHDSIYIIKSKKETVLEELYDYYVAKNGSDDNNQLNDKDNQLNDSEKLSKLKRKRQLRMQKLNKKLKLTRMNEIEYFEMSMEYTTYMAKDVKCYKVTSVENEKYPGTIYVLDCETSPKNEHMNEVTHYEEDKLVKERVEDHKRFKEMNTNNE